MVFPWVCSRCFFSPPAPAVRPVSSINHQAFLLVRLDTLAIVQQIVVLHGLLIQLYTGTGPGSEIVELGVKRVHMIPYYLVLRLDGALWLTIIFKPLLTPRRVVKSKIDEKLVILFQGSTPPR